MAEDLRGDLARHKVLLLGAAGVGLLGFLLFHAQSSSAAAPTITQSAQPQVVAGASGFLLSNQLSTLQSLLSSPAATFGNTPVAPTTPVPPTQSGTVSGGQPPATPVSLGTPAGQALTYGTYLNPWNLPATSSIPGGAAEGIFGSQVPVLPGYAISISVPPSEVFNGSTMSPNTGSLSPIITALPFSNWLSQPVYQLTNGAWTQVTGTALQSLADTMQFGPGQKTTLGYTGPGTYAGTYQLPALPNGGQYTPAVPQKTPGLNYVT